MLGNLHMPATRSSICESSLRRLVKRAITAVGPALNFLASTTGARSVARRVVFLGASLVVLCAAERVLADHGATIEQVLQPPEGNVSFPGTSIGDRNVTPMFVPDPDQESPEIQVDLSQTTQQEWRPETGGGAEFHSRWRAGTGYWFDHLTTINLLADGTGVAAAGFSTSGDPLSHGLTVDFEVIYKTASPPPLPPGCGGVYDEEVQMCDPTPFDLHDVMFAYEIPISGIVAPGGEVFVDVQVFYQNTDILPDNVPIPRITKTFDAPGSFDMSNIFSHLSLGGAEGTDTLIPVRVIGHFEATAGTDGQPSFVYTAPAGSFDDTFSSLPGYPAQPDVTQVTDNEFADTRGRLVSDSNAVWKAGPRLSIFDGESVTVLSDFLDQESYPATSGSSVVWLDLFSNVFLYDGVSISQLTTNGFVGRDHPNVSGSNVVWAEHDGNDYEIFMYDGETITQLTDNSTDDRFPDIHGTRVAWTNGSNVFLYEDGTTTELTGDSYPAGMPAVSASAVVWSGYDGHDEEIYYFDGVDVTQLTDNSTLDFLAGYFPADDVLSGPNVVWVSQDGTDRAVFLFDGHVITQVANNCVGYCRATIFGNNVVWEDDQDIYLWNGGEVTAVTNKPFDDFEPHVSGSTVVWTGRDGNDYEIYTWGIPNSTTALVDIGLMMPGSTLGGAESVGGVNAVFEEVVVEGAFVAQPISTADLSQESLDALGGFRLAGDTPQIWDLSFHGDFVGNVTLTLGYDEMLLGAVAETELFIMHFDHELADWVRIDPLAQNTDLNTITFTTASLSVFALATKVPEPGSWVLLLLGFAVAASCVRCRSRPLGTRAAQWLTLG